jgi:hypothetical protein
LNRIFQLSKLVAQTVDPSTFSVTNTFPYENLNNVTLDDKNPEQFSFEFDRTVFTFKTTYRAHLLCQLYECICKKAPNKLKVTGPFECERLRKNGTHVDCKLSLTYFGIIEFDPFGNIVQEYKWINISRCGMDESSNGFFFEYSGRTKIFLSNNVVMIVNTCKLLLKLLGLDRVPVLSAQPLGVIIKYRLDTYSSIPSAISVFDVNKVTKRSSRPLPRQLHVSEVYIKETDSSGFQTLSFHRIDSIYALVRIWGSTRDFKIEFNDGSSRFYNSTMRDNLLATLYDVCQSTGNVRVIVTGEVSDGLRLMPRFAEEDYKATLKDAFFGASSIEAWFLSRLIKIFKATVYENEAVIHACRELNANVPCPGVSPNTDLNTIKLALTRVLSTIQNELIKAFQNDKLNNSREIAIMLQTLFRLIPCIHGYKCFVEVKEVDTRQLLLQLLRYSDDFVHYWTLEVLMVLCRCPLEPRNMQQEFINKHTLLTDKLLRYLTDLMYYKSDDFEEISEESEKVSEEAEPTGNSQPNSTVLKKAVSANPSPAAHIPSASFQRESLSNDPRVEVKTVTGSDSVHFTPNALLVIGAASLLESLISSRRDTSSPELLNDVLDLLAERCDVLINMLRSTSFLIMENASILMFALLKNRPSVAPLMRELALSECLVLKNFYYAIFSPSNTQRFISRFLIATWMSGNEKSNPAKALLARIIPSGLLEYLKFVAITEEQRKNLDLLEEEFYTAFVSSGSTPAGKIAESELMYNRMRKRISSAIRERSVDAVAQLSIHQQISQSTINNPNSVSIQSGSSSSPLPGHVAIQNKSASERKKQPENYRIMFHIMTQDHKLPDLIWNEQTRLELRTALESEIKEFDREQRLLGSKKIAWNFQQFFVKYESLREELQVGPIYIRYFLDAGDAFLKTLENPNHVVLFEKLFRRVLVNIEHQPSLSILCVRCLNRLYEVCANLIGTFDDMLILVRMLEQATNLELLQYILDLLVILCQDESNLRQLLDKGFVNTMMKYVTLAHINPDQIGNVLARATTNILMIKDASQNGVIETNEPTVSASTASAISTNEDEQLARQLRRSMWVPEDTACPKVWFAAPPGKSPPPTQVQRGPYRVSELLLEFESGRVTEQWLLAAKTSEESDDDRFDVIVDTGRWRPLSEYFQLKLQMLFPGKAIYSPAQVAAKSLKLLQRLQSIHRASNSKGVPFYPIPMSKKIMSDPSHLTVFAQLLLSNDPQVVENAADLMRSLVEFNINANSKLYLTGTFFFAARYTGNNFNAISWLFHVTHLKQSFHDSAASIARDLSLNKKSILGALFPQAMISILNNYGPEKFAAVHTGDYDTPEVIWNAELRKHLVEMIELHLGDFPTRIRQYTSAPYEYVPLATVHYQNLEKEIYVHEYYLKNLCDEVKFPDWPIGEPLVLLRECIQRWREEMSKGVVDSSISDAKLLLKLPNKYDNGQLRKAYKNLAREFHPDKNPKGREMFEKIQQAYELLSSVELQVTETNLLNVLLLVKTQNILYRRFPQQIGDQKYPAYPLLMQILRVPALQQVVTGVDGDLLVACAMLLYYTTSVSPLNAKEFVKVGVVTKLYELFTYTISLRSIVAAEGLFKDLLMYVMKTFTAIVNIDEGREEIKKYCPVFSENIYDLLGLKKIAPISVENGIEVISRCASTQELQTYFVNSGVIWRLIPLLLEFDGTFSGDYQDESQRLTYNQCASNVLAIVSAKALGRLGGYMFDELQSPHNEYVKRALAFLLTQPLASLLRNRRPWELLNALNENVETTTKIWNVTMRKELMEFVAKIDSQRSPGSSENDLAASHDFVYSNLREELCINGVYVRIFNKTKETADILDPSQFCRELLQYLRETIQNNTVNQCQIVLTALQRLHLDYASEALRNLSETHKYIPNDVATHKPSGIETVLMMLDLPAESEAFQSGANTLAVLCQSNDFIVEYAQNQQTLIWRFLKCLSTVESTNVLPVWNAAEAMVTHPIGLQALIEQGAIARILGALLAVKGYANQYQSRLAAISLLSKMLWNQTKGDQASIMSSRYLVNFVKEID